MSKSVTYGAIERRAGLLAAAATVAVGLDRLLPGPDLTRELQTNFALSGFVLLLCWGLLTVVAEPRRRAAVRGVATGVVVGLGVLLALIVAQTSGEFALVTYRQV